MAKSSGLQKCIQKSKDTAKRGGGVKAKAPPVSQQHQLAKSRPRSMSVVDNLPLMRSMYSCVRQDLARRRSAPACLQPFQYYAEVVHRHTRETYDKNAIVRFWQDCTAESLRKDATRQQVRDALLNIKPPGNHSDLLDLAVLSLRSVVGLCHELDADDIEDVYLKLLKQQEELAELDSSSANNYNQQLHEEISKVVGVLQTLQTLQRKGCGQAGADSVPKAGRRVLDAMRFMVTMGLKDALQNAEVSGEDSLKEGRDSMQDAVDAKLNEHDCTAQELEDQDPGRVNRDSEMSLACGPPSPPEMPSGDRQRFHRSFHRRALHPTIVTAPSNSDAHSRQDNEMDISRQASDASVSRSSEQHPQIKSNSSTSTTQSSSTTLSWRSKHAHCNLKMASKNHEIATVSMTLEKCLLPIVECGGLIVVPTGKPGARPSPRKVHVNTAYCPSKSSCVEPVSLVTPHSPHWPSKEFEAYCERLVDMKQLAETSSSTW